MQNFKYICFSTCVVSIIFGVILGLLAIWGTLPEEFGFRCGMTLLLLFIAGCGGGIAAWVFGYTPDNKE